MRACGKENKTALNQAETKITVKLPVISLSIKLDVTALALFVQVKNIFRLDVNSK